MAIDRQRMLADLERLTNAHGPSGTEGEVERLLFEMFDGGVAKRHIVGIDGLHRRRVVEYDHEMCRHPGGPETRLTERQRKNQRREQFQNQRWGDRQSITFASRFADFGFNTP